MSAEGPKCPRCRLYRGEVALLRAEIAGLRNSVLVLTRHPTASAPVLEIVGMHQPQRLELARPFVDGRDWFCRVSLTYPNQLSARCEVPMDDPAQFLRFFEDLAQHKNGWEGEKKVASREGQFTITCRYEGKLYRPEVSMDVSCSLDYPTFDPYWAVHLHLDVDPDSLDDLSAQARVVFTNTTAEPGAAIDPARDVGSGSS
jgi:hypothetical protein